MALNVGRLFITLDANASGLFRTLSRAMENIEKFSKHVKRAARDVQEVSTAMTAIGGAALHMAAQVDGPTARAMQNLETATKQLAVPVARMLIPAVQTLTKGIQDLARWVDGLNPAIKNTIATVAIWAVGVGGAAFAIGKFAGIISGLAGVLSGVFGAIAAIGVGPLLLITAGVAAVAVAAVFLHRAWRTNWQGIQDFTADVVNAVTEYFRGQVKNIGDAWSGLFKLLKAVLNNWLDTIAAIQRATGVNWLDTEGMRAGLDRILDSLQSGAFLSEAFKAGKALATTIGDGFSDELKVIKKQLGLDNFFSVISKGGQLANVGPVLPLFSGAIANFAATQGRMISTRSTDAKLTKSQLDLMSRLFNVRGGPRDGYFDNDMMSQESRVLMKTGVSVRGGPLMSGPTSMSALAVHEAQIAAEQAFVAQLGSINDGLKVAGSIFVGRLGDLGSIIQTAAQGFEQGGAIGAALAVLADFLSRTQAFADLVGAVTSIIGTVTKLLEPAMRQLVEPIAKIVAAVGMVLAPIFKALEPVFRTLSQGLTELSPIIYAASTFLFMLEPAFNMLATGLQEIFTILDPVIKVLYVLLRLVGLGILNALKGIYSVWNAIVTTLAGMVDTIVATISFGAIKNGGDFIRAAMANTASVDDALAKLEHATVDNVQAYLKNAAAVDDVNKKLDEFSQSLTNVPAGFKVALAQFGAMDGIDMGGAGFGAGGGMNIDTVIVQADDAKSLMAELRKEARKELFRLSGNRHGGGRRGDEP